MEEEIKAEFIKNGFTLHEEQEILQKCECSFSFPFLPSNPVRILPQLVPFLFFFWFSQVLHSAFSTSSVLPTSFRAGNFSLSTGTRLLSTRLGPIFHHPSWNQLAVQSILIKSFMAFGIAPRKYVFREVAGVALCNQIHGGSLGPTPCLGFPGKLVKEWNKIGWFTMSGIWVYLTSPLHQPKKRHFF